LRYELKGNNEMARLITQSEVNNHFDYWMAIINVRVGESNDEAWYRHLMKSPNDIYATIRVFNH
jgi:hypothetical protein